MANIKQLMGMDTDTLHELGVRSGLNFPTGMKKSAMAIQLSQAAASGWMEVNNELMSTEAEDIHASYGTSEMLSDAAHAAQMIHSAGFGNTFHQAMASGENKHLSVLESYLSKIGATPEDVWLHMPKQNPDEQSRPFNVMKAYMRDTLLGNQDIMPKLQGHYSNDVMAEYSTPNGNVQDVYSGLASMYLNQPAYESTEQYQRDLAGVSRILSSKMGPAFSEVAHVSATGGKASYMDALPQIGDPSISSHVAYPRQPLNQAGLPLGSLGSAVGDRSNYSLIASLTGRPETRSEASSAAYNRVSSAVSGLAQVYRGGDESGMNPYRHVTSERDMILDSATRYVDLDKAYSGYDNVDEPAYNADTIRQIVNNDYDKMEAVVPQSFDPAQSARVQRQDSRQANTDFVMLPGNGFTGNFDSPQNYNAGRSRREGIAIANMDAAAAPQQEPSFNGDLDKDPVTYHRNIKQGTDEWLRMRENYDITGSGVGSLLGNNAYTTMAKKVTELEGLYPSSRDSMSEFSKKMFARGHASEAAARPRVEQEYGINIEEVGAITNSNYPNMMYSPDGLIGDDALWEHKNPNVTNKFADLSAGEHKDYYDQIQLGMHLSGRSRTLFSQTVGNNTKSEWIDANPDWYQENKEQLDSIAGRRSAVRDYTTGNQKAYEDAMENASDDKERALLTRRFRLGAQKAAKGDASEFIQDSPASNQDYSQPAASSSTGLSVVGMPSPMSQAVKEGILAAQEENKTKGGGSGSSSSPQADADFDDLGNPRGWNNSTLRRNLADEGNGGGGGGMPPKEPPFNMFSGQSPWGNIASGIAGGSMASTRGGFMNALRNGGPIGQTVALGLGAANTTGEIISSMADYIGVANDAGESSAVGYDSKSQGLEMLGLNQDQADRTNRVVHSDYNRLANGDPSGVIRVATGTRGLLSVSDINDAKGDPVRLGELFAERAKARGWSDARIAGAAEMAGLDGFARITHASDAQMSSASRVVAARDSEDVEQDQFNFRNANALRAGSSPDYAIPRYGLASSAAAVAAGVAMGGTFGSLEHGKQDLNSLLDTVEQLESGGKWDAKSLTSTARGSMQVLASTAKNPGYGIAPAKDDSPEELRRVGRELQVALVNKYGGDIDKGGAAYTDGAATVDRAVQDYGENWLQHMPAQAQKRVEDLHKAGYNEGAGKFLTTSVSASGHSPTVIQLNLNAKINNSTATATVTSPTGQTQSQTVNVAGGGTHEKR